MKNIKIFVTTTVMMNWTWTVKTTITNAIFAKNLDEITRCGIAVPYADYGLMPCALDGILQKDTSVIYVPKTKI